MIRFRCPRERCGREHEMPARAAGRKMACAGCGGRLRVPGNAQEPAQEEDSPSSAGAWHAAGATLFVALVGLAMVGVAGGFWVLASRRAPVLAVVPPEPPKPPVKEISEADVIAKAKPATARVLCRNSWGSGFHYGEGVVATNAHVVNGELARHLKVTFPSSATPDRKHNARVALVDRERDIALLIIDDAPTATIPLAEKEPRQGDRLVVIGSPATPDPEAPVLLNHSTNGTLSNIRFVRKNNVEWYAIDAAINGGNSGGPVIDVKSGGVIGLATWVFVGKSAQNFAVPLKTVRETIKKRPAETDRASAEFDLREAYERLDVSVSAYLEGMRFYRDAMLAAARRGERGNDALVAAGKFVDHRAKFHEDGLLSAVMPDLKEVLSNPALPAGLRDNEDFHALLKLHAALKADVLGPNYPDATTYARLYFARKSARDRLVSVMRPKLGTTPPRLLEWRLKPLYRNAPATIRENLKNYVLLALADLE